MLNHQVTVTPTYSSVPIQQPVLNVPLIANNIISPMAVNPGNAPFYMLDNLVFRSNIAVPNVNNDPNLRRNMVRYYWSKLKTWLTESSTYKKLYKYMYVVEGNKVKLGIDQKPESKANDIIKYDYIINDIINKKDLYNILDKFCKINNVNYWDLQEINVKNKLKKYIYVKIKHVLMKN